MKDHQCNGAKEGVTQRYESLDCLRGLAASTVLLNHVLVLMRGPNALLVFVDGRYRIDTLLDLFPIRLLYAGHQAVILFFVLSGFALYILFETIKQSVKTRAVVPVFILSRWIRLYPVYIVSVGAAIGAHFATDALALKYSDHFWLPTGVVDAQNVVGHATLVGFFDVTRFNGPIWSIVHEMRVSMFFPVIFYLVCRLGVRALFLVAMMPVAAALALYFPVLASDRYATSAVLTAHYSSFFFLGAIMAHYRVDLVRFVRSMRTSIASCVLIIGLALYIYGFFISLPLFAWCFTDLVAGVGAAVIIAFCLSFPILERSAGLKSLGKMSYSLYLIHAPCLVIVYKVAADRFPFGVCSILMIALSVCASALLWSLLESRSLRWSRMSRRVGRMQLLTTHGS